MSNRPISVVELERRRLATAALLLKDLEAITAWGLKNMSQEVLLTIQPSHAIQSPDRTYLEYCSHIWGAAAPTTLSVLDAVQRRAIRLIGDPALTCHLQPISHRRTVGDLSLFYRHSNGFC
nr:unnamed protein product [Callosobruchus chinensis]